MSLNHRHVHSILANTLLHHQFFPLLLKMHFSCSAFPLAPRGTRVAFLLNKQFSSELETEAKVILTLGETDAG